MQLITSKSISECKQEFKNAFRSEQLYGTVSDLDDLKKDSPCRFCVTNRAHLFKSTRDKGWGLMIYVHCKGVMIPSESGVTIKAKIVYGFRSLFQMFLITAITFILYYAKGEEYGISIPVMIAMTLICWVAVFGYSFLLSRFSDLGRDDEEELLEFLENNLEVREVENSGGSE